MMGLVRAYLRELKEHIRVERAILFGSRARGDWVDVSDVDLIIVSPDLEGIRFLDRLELLHRFWRRRDVALEVFGYTPEESERGKRLSVLIHSAVSEGLTVEP